MVVFGVGNEMNTFSERLKALRAKENITQKQLAEKLEISSGSIIAYEKATKVPSIDVCVKIAIFFNVSLDWLCGLTDDVKNYQIRTYGDAFRMIVALHRGIGVNCLDISPIEVYDDWAISFSNLTLNQTISAWQKIKTLYDSKTIDDEIYSLWVEKQLSVLDKEHVFEEISDEKRLNNNEDNTQN